MCCQSRTVASGPRWPLDRRKSSYSRCRQRMLSDLRELSLRLQGRAKRVARLVARDRARGTAGELAHTADAGRDAPAGSHRTGRRPLSLVRKHTSAAAEARTPATAPHRLSTATPPCVRERGHPPGAAIIEAEQDRRQGRLCTQANR
jgi:hypothetical protein